MPKGLYFILKGSARVGLECTGTDRKVRTDNQWNSPPKIPFTTGKKVTDVPRFPEYVKEELSASKNVHRYDSDGDLIQDLTAEDLENLK